MQAYVLDSYALLAYLTSEPAGVEVRQLIVLARDNEAILYFSQMNMGEVYYIVHRLHGPAQAQQTIRSLRDLPIILCEANEARILAAADLKAQYPISYADAFAAALAKELEAILVTGDPEFKILEPQLEVMWL